MLNRLLGIIYILMNKGTVTAGELAKRFEVSARTIYRDIDALALAGIPVYATKGKNGGIRLTEEFVLDKMLVTKEEQTQILAALASLQETGASKETETLEKLGEFFKEKPQNWVSIDFSDWSGMQKQLMEQIRKGILEHRLLSFEYYGRGIEKSLRVAEPLQLHFKDHAWYLRAYCRTRQDFRLFKVIRMRQVEVLEEHFAPEREWDEEKNSQELYNLENMIQLELWIDKRETYRILDCFDQEKVTVLEDGNYRVNMCCPAGEWVYEMILSFGPSARVLKPEFIKREVVERIIKMRNIYS